MNAAGEYTRQCDPRAVESILGQIGNTPLLRFSRLTKDYNRVEIYGKAEWFNPGGSVKDRLAGLPSHL